MKTSTRKEPLQSDRRKTCALKNRSLLPNPLQSVISVSYLIHVSFISCNLIDFVERPEYFFFSVSEDTHCEMLTFYCNVGIMVTFPRCTEPIRFHVITMMCSRLGNMSALSWIFPCLANTVFIVFLCVSI